MQYSDDIKNVAQIVRCYGKHTSTKPLFCVLDDGSYAVVKYPNNPEGNLILINEWLSYKIASKVGLDVPECGLCWLDDTYSMSEEFSMYMKQNNDAFSDKNYGVCFYSSYIDHIVPISIGIVPRISNIKNFYTMVLFDHLVYNKDRHPGNLLIQMEKPIKYFAIDHSHVFKNQAIWDRYAFAQGIESGDYLDKDVLELNDDVYSYFFAYMDLDIQLLTDARLYMERELSQDYYHTIISEIPEGWIQKVPIEDIQALEKYLAYRTGHLADIERLIISGRRNHNEL